jgi:hypothetical protein
VDYIDIYPIIVKFYTDGKFNEFNIAYSNGVKTYKIVHQESSIEQVFKFTDNLLLMIEKEVYHATH